MLVHNNSSTGQDAALLKRFKEPAWNFQVLRFLDSNAKDIIPRRDQVWTLDAVSKRLVEALEKAKRPVPKYLQSLVGTSNLKEQQVAAFAMHCFWTGEYQLGNIDGVVETEAGWLDGREVTLVHYNKSEISIEQLAKRAAEVRCAQKVYTPEGKQFGRLQPGKLDSSYRVASRGDQKRQLQQVPRLTRVPNLNATQLTKLNALAPRNMSAALEWLSPSQLRQIR